jgi:polyketide cyclase/dehydrase/lipid transport protein
MEAFTVTRDSPLSPAQAWARVVDWPRHGRYVPFTRVTVTVAAGGGIGTVFTARTGLGRVGFDDPMEVVDWSPPGLDGRGHCRLEKRGRVMAGWAELSVEPHGTGARVTWREAAKPARLPAFTDRVSALAGRLLFGRVLKGLLGG